MTKSLYERFLVRPGTKVRLGQWDADDTAGYEAKETARELLARNIERLAKRQHLLYAEGKRALLVVFQAMDAGGKDGTIRQVMSGLNPQSCHVTAFRAPSETERAHDFLWRIHQAVPARGEIGIFNRSHYEDVLVVRVRKLVPKSVWSKRYLVINEFERALAESGVTLLKFFLHISPEEQAERLRERLADPTQSWKLSPTDLEDRRLWGDFARAYEAALSRCSTPWGPWFVIPANKKWFRNLAVSEIIVHTLDGLNMAYPKPTFDPATMVVK
ncbi:MAG: polyphosphate kinase 2 family protein [Planctomycetes bacterium]|nr:polyphosphate kinase 2 family protein [Planctomycetota bacterium]